MYLFFVLLIIAVQNHGGWTKVKEVLSILFPLEANHTGFHFSFVFIITIINPELFNQHLKIIVSLISLL